MQLPKVIAGAIAVGIASSAHAAFTGWTVESRGNIGGVNVYQVFANFDVPTDIVLNCFKHQVTIRKYGGRCAQRSILGIGGFMESCTYDYGRSGRERLLRDNYRPYGRIGFDKP